MSKPVKSDGTTQQALLDALTTPLTQQIADLLLVSTNLRSCKKDALTQLQTDYQTHFGFVNAEVEKFLVVRGQQAPKSGVAVEEAKPVEDMPQEATEAPIPGHECCADYEENEVNDVSED